MIDYMQATAEEAEKYAALAKKHGLPALTGEAEQLIQAEVVRGKLCESELADGLLPAWLAVVGVKTAADWWISHAYCDSADEMIVCLMGSDAEMTELINNAYMA